MNIFIRHFLFHPCRRTLIFRSREKIFGLVLKKTGRNWEKLSEEKYRIFFRLKKYVLAFMRRELNSFFTLCQLSNLLGTVHSISQFLDCTKNCYFSLNSRYCTGNLKKTWAFEDDWTFNRPSNKKALQLKQIC